MNPIRLSGIIFKVDNPERSRGLSLFNMEKRRKISIFINFIAIVLFLVAALTLGPLMSSSKQITYNEFLTMVDSGQVDKVVITDDEITIKVLGDNTTYYTGYIEYENLVDKLQTSGVTFERGKTSDGFGTILLSLILNFGPFLIFIWIISRIFAQQGGNNILSVGKSKAKLNVDNDTKVTFEDVAGQEEAKEQLTEIIDYLHNPQKYQAIGAKIPKGALLVGPPGTGKTLLARAVAGEAHVPFYSVTGSDFIEMYVGVGASRIRDLFEQAKKSAPCIIFIDEVDSIAKTRDGGYKTGSNDEREQTLNQLLSEMDGFDSSKGIIILAATNRPESLDKAFLRAGRFDRKVIVERPDFKGRVDTLKVHTRNVKLSDDVDFNAIAYATTGSVGADLENIVNEAALYAVKCGRQAVTQSDLMEAVETVFAGKEKKDRIMSDEEKRLVAFHEVGHAVVAAIQKNTSPVQKITIVPRTKGSLGYTLQVPEEEKFLSTKAEMLAEIATLLGGRCAEEVFFNTITSGASNDIQRATDIARQMITLYGMSERFDMMSLETIESIYLDRYSQRNCSEETSAIIDNEILDIIKRSHKLAKAIVSENKELITEVAEYLLIKESITGSEFMAIFKKHHPEMNLKVPTIEDFAKEEPKTTSRKQRIRKTPAKEEIPEISEPEEVLDLDKDIDDEPPIVDVVETEPDNVFIEEENEVVSDEPEIEEIKEVEEEQPVEEVVQSPQPAKIDRPSASVLGPGAGKKKKKKKKPTSKATAEDMANLLNSVNISTTSTEKPEKKTEEKEEAPASEERKAEAVGAPPKRPVSDYANNDEDDDLDEFTEDLY